MEYKRVYITQDDDSHWYVIPYELKEEFDSLCEKAYSEDDFEEFTEKFDGYATGGSLDLVEFYVKSEHI